MRDNPLTRRSFVAGSLMASAAAGPGSASRFS